MDRRRLALARRGVSGVVQPRHRPGPRADRGYVAAVITAVTYFAANAYPVAWSIDAFSRLLTAAMLPGVVVLALLVSDRVAALRGLVESLSTGYEQFGTGRF